MTQINIFVQIYQRPLLSKAGKPAGDSMSTSHYTDAQLHAARAASEIQQAFSDMQGSHPATRGAW